VLAGTSVAAGLPIWALLSLPILFAAGMSLLDTIDGSFMNFAYGWAFSKPVRKVYYNIAITGLSVFVAFYIGTLELAQVLTTQLNLRGGLWNYAAHFNINSAGFTIVGIFVGVWAFACSTGVTDGWRSVGSVPRFVPSTLVASGPTCTRPGSPWERCTAPSPSTSSSHNDTLDVSRRA